MIWLRIRLQPHRARSAICSSQSARSQGRIPSSGMVGLANWRSSWPRVAEGRRGRHVQRRQPGAAVPVGQGPQQGPHPVEGAPGVRAGDERLGLPVRGQGAQAVPLRPGPAGVRRPPPGAAQQGAEGGVPLGPPQPDGAVEAAHGLTRRPARRGRVQQLGDRAAAPPDAGHEQPGGDVLRPGRRLPQEDRQAPAAPQGPQRFGRAHRSSWSSCTPRSSSSSVSSPSLPMLCIARRGT